jgi:hypothetical protein
MRFEPRSRVLLDTYEPRLADAVASVLRRHGTAAWTEPTGAGEVAVHVPAAARDSAMRTLAERMEEVHAALAAAAAPAGRPAPEPAAAPDDDPARPIVLERIRRLGFLAALLVPLLVVSLAAPGMPMSVALAVFVGGLVAVTALRARARDRSGP